MSLDHATVRRIASLARIRVEDHEVEPLCRELNGILGWIEQLNEVDVTGVAPLTGASSAALASSANSHPTDAANAASADAANRFVSMRTDTVTDGGYADKVLSNAPERIGDFFAVPKVVE